MHRQCRCNHRFPMMTYLPKTQALLIQQPHQRGQIDVKILKRHLHTARAERQCTEVKLNHEIGAYRFDATEAGFDRGREQTCHQTPAGHRGHRTRTQRSRLCIVTPRAFANHCKYCSAKQHQANSAHQRSCNASNVEKDRLLEWQSSPTVLSPNSCHTNRLEV